MKIHAIRTGSVRIKTAQVERRGAGILSKVAIFVDSNWSEWLPTFVWVIEHPEGVMVIDTGQATHLLGLAGRSLHPFARWEVAFRIEPEQEIGPQLNELGIRPRDVKCVVLTHLHMDHDAGLLHFPNSPILAARSEVTSASGFMGMVRGYLPQRWPSWFNPIPLDLDDGQYGPFSASKRLTKAGDIVAVSTPGHTASHLSVIVNDGDIAIFVAGDASYSEASMLTGKVDGVSSAARASKVTLAKIRHFIALQPTVYLPTHDPDSAGRLATREVALASSPSWVQKDAAE